MTPLTMRRALREDLPAIVSLLANDAFGATREDASMPLQEVYLQAFDAIDADPNQLLIVAVLEERVVGTLQLSFVPGVSHLGSWRAQIEAVRVHEQMRGSGLGRKLLKWSFEQARQRGCRLVQPNCDQSRHEAHRLNESIGFFPHAYGFQDEALTAASATLVTYRRHALS